MRYEAMLILPPDEESAPFTVNEIKELIAKFGGKEITVDTWGIRKLAYAIDQFTQGYYALIKFDMKPNRESLKELDCKLKYQDSIIRHLIVKEVKVS